jgi:hypothetical protein
VTLYGKVEGDVDKSDVYTRANDTFVERIDVYLLDLVYMSLVHTRTR